MALEKLLEQREPKRGEKKKGKAINLTNFAWIATVRLAAIRSAKHVAPVETRHAKKKKLCNAEPKPLNAGAITRARVKGYTKFLCLPCGLACRSCGAEMTVDQIKKARAKAKDSKEKALYCKKCANK